jgi:arylsulfatase A-like enzyme
MVQATLGVSTRTEECPMHTRVVVHAFTLVPLLLRLAMALASPAAAAAPACAQIRQACQSAGFMQGGGKTGAGLKVDCLDPLLQGTPQPRRATRPLPAVDPATVAACKANHSGDPGAKHGRKQVAVRSDAATDTPVPPKPRHPGSAPAPNIVFILADDFSLDLLAPNVFGSDMPHLQQMASEGTTFAHYFVTDSLCCPSRSSIFTGKLPHNTGVFRNAGADGGMGGFLIHGNEPVTFAVALHDVGYRTAMLGKYLNGYRPEKSGIPQGWSEWDVDGEKGYAEYNYDLNENGKLRSHPEYLTDEISRLGQAFIDASAPGPFFIELASFAPHAPYTPPERYMNSFAAYHYGKTATFGARPDATAPAWLQQIPPLTPQDLGTIDTAFQKRLGSIKAIDDMIGEIRALLRRLGLDKNTYVVFSSDNGYHMGEYSLRPGKMTPFDTDIQVPLIVVGPGVAAGRVVTEIAENIDLCPTFTELAGAGPPTSPDGHSLSALLRTSPTPDHTSPWRRAALIEHHHPGPEKSDPDLPEPRSGNPPTYEALRTSDALYVEYSDTKDEIGLYDLHADPQELHNIAAGQSAATLKRWHDALSANATCKGAQSCWEAQLQVP